MKRVHYPVRFLSICIVMLFMQVLQAQQRPNIVLIMTDDMGYSDIGCYGSEIPTPNIDALAKGGVRFSQFYNTSRCCPTRASLMTGLFPHQAGIGQMSEDPNSRNEKGEDKNNWGTPGYQGFLNDHCVTTAELLAGAGYHRYMAGKWHLGFHEKEKLPLQRGFEKYYGILAGASSYFRPQGGRGLTYNNTQLAPPTGNYYTTDAFTDSAIQFIDEQQDQKPFFLYLAYNAPHWPLHAKPDDIALFKDKYLTGWDGIREARYQRQLASGLIKKAWGFSERDTAVRAWTMLSQNEKEKVAYRMAVYAAQVKAIDDNIGRLISFLKREGKYDNTLIIFLSDNGACAETYDELGSQPDERINDPDFQGAVSYGVGWANASNTPFRKWKTRAEEGGIAAPFIMHWPVGITATNTICHTPSYLIDIMPTIQQVTGASYPKQSATGTPVYALPGRTMVPVFAGKNLPAHEYMYWEHQNHGAVRKGDWKALYDLIANTWELYNLSNDRSEQHNLARQQPEILRDLQQHWHAWAKENFVLPKRKG